MIFHFECSSDLQASLVCVAVEQAETNAVEKQPPYRELSGKGSAEQQSKEAWQSGQGRSNTFLQRIFSGQLQSRTTCPCCGHSSFQFDECQSLSLVLPDKLFSSWRGLSMQVSAASSFLYAQSCFETTSTLKQQAHVRSL